ncbi:MAG: heme-binding protein [Verrucomicrobia bacterium]|nr:MAG: heme-binding protein [Verrucomicrobiota bacterium]
MQHLRNDTLGRVWIAFCLAAAIGSRAGTVRSWLDESPRALEGFRVELVYRVPPEQGSWVSLAVDPRGRLIASDQDGPLYRLTLREDGPPAVERLEAPVGSAQGLCWAHDSLYVVANHWLSREEREAGRGPGYETGLYRLRDRDGDDRFDEVRLLRRFDGPGEHGPHAVVAGPDGRLYLVAGNGCSLPDPEVSRVPRHWQMDHLVPRLGQTDGFWTEKRPGGWVCRTDPEGRTFELIAIGLRNPYDLAFNADGELFTFDADMEWDMGVAWYRPTRVNHVVSGAEFGWRTGSAKWPDDWFDSLGSVVDVGASSPTGLAFAYGARFPARYQKALFMGDWSFGRILALHLEPDGCSWRGEFEVFVSGSPLAVTDLVIRPQDGALYFAVGGRETASAIYRVRYVGPDPTDPTDPSDPREKAARARRRAIEALHREIGSDAVDMAWPALGSPDRVLRYVARVALEHQPVACWADRALRETHPRRAIAALAALARCTDQPRQHRAILRRLASFRWDDLPAADRGDWLRALQLAVLRGGTPDAAERKLLLAALDPHYPADRWPWNRDLAALLLRLEAPGVIGRTLDLLEAAPSQEQQTYYLLALRAMERPHWTRDQLARVFRWFRDAAARRGGVTFTDYLGLMRSEFIDHLTEEDRQALADLLAPPAEVDPLEQLRQQRQLVRTWTVADLLDDAAQAPAKGDPARGRRIFAEAMCLNCHRFAGQGGMTGPDLTGVTRRLDTRNLLESILEPSKVISDQYRTVEVETRDGDLYTGRVANIDEETLYLMVDLLNPAAIVKLPHGDIASIRPSALSMMPTNLLDVFTRQEILDLLAWLATGGHGTE